MLVKTVEFKSRIPNPAKYCPCSLSVKLPVHRPLSGVSRQWVPPRTGVYQCEVSAQRWSFNPGFLGGLRGWPVQGLVYDWGGCPMPSVGVRRKRTFTWTTQNGAIKLYIGPVHIWALQQPCPVLPAKSQNLVEWIVQDLFERNLIKQKINASNYTINKHHLMVITSSNYTVPKNFTLPLQLALRIGIRDFGKTIAITGQHRGWLRRGYPFWESIRSNWHEDSIERCSKQNCGWIQSDVHQQAPSDRESTTLPHSKPAAWPGISQIHIVWICLMILIIVWSSFKFYHVKKRLRAPSELFALLHRHYDGYRHESSGVSPQKSIFKYSVASQFKLISNKWYYTF